MIIDFLEYEGKEYKIREIKLPEFGHVTLGSSSLLKILFNDNCVPISDYAEVIDNKIFYYLQDDEMRLSDKNLTVLFKSFNL